MTDLTKDEIVKMARECNLMDGLIPVQSQLERFATLCRAPLVAENAALKQAHEINADTLNAMQVEIDDWKARALKAEQAGDRAVPDAEDYDLIDRYLRNNLDDADYGEYLAALNRLVTPQPAAQEPTSAAPANAKPEKAKPYAWRNPMNGVVISNDKKERLLCVGAGYPNFSEPLYAAGQQYLKENGK